MKLKYSVVPWFTERILFVATIFICMIAMLTACSALEKRLENNDYYNCWKSPKC